MQRSQGQSGLWETELPQLIFCMRLFSRDEYKHFRKVHCSVGILLALNLVAKRENCEMGQNKQNFFGKCQGSCGFSAEVQKL